MDSPAFKECWLDLPGYRLRYTEEGQGADVFLCLHGLVDNIRIWDALAPKLSQAGRVLRLDQRGHGESTGPAGPYQRKDLAGDVVAVLDAAGVEKAILVGHSMGGIVSMATALEHPDRVKGLVLLGAASQCNEKAAEFYETIAQAGEKGGTAGITQVIYGKNSQKKVVGDAQVMAEVTRTLKTLLEDPLTPKLGKVACPSLLLVGEKDPMGSRASEIIQKALPQGSSELEVYPEQGHWIHVKAADEVEKSLSRWWKGGSHGR